MSKRSPRTAKAVSEQAPARLWFYDASAIAKAYLDEAESSSVRRWMSAGPVGASRLTIVEVASAIHRRARSGLLSPALRDAALAALSADVPKWNLLELTDAVADRAIRLMMAHRITSGDAVQLASALVARDRDVEGFGRFVAYDARLLGAARAEGLPTEEY